MATAITLMYRELGRVYGAPHLLASELLAGLSEVLRHVYRVDDPQTHPTLRAVAAKVGSGKPYIEIRH